MLTYGSLPGDTNGYRNPVEKHTEKRLFQRSRKWKDYINMNLIRMVCEPEKLMELADFGTSNVGDLASDTLNYFLDPCHL
jgi:hypothetical protein